MRIRFYIRAGKLAIGLEIVRPIRRRKGLVLTVDFRERGICPLVLYLLTMHLAERKHGNKKSAEDKKVNIKKIGSGLIVAISMLAFNAAAQDPEQCADLVTEMTGDPVTQGTADALRCAPDGLWTHGPIWQFQGGKGKKGAAGDGCDVHQKLARLIYEKPVVKVSKGKGKPTDNQPDGRGAARALADGQLEYAVQLLEELQSSIATSKLNPDYGVSEGKDSDGYTAAQRAYLVSLWADTMAKRIIDDDGTRCIE